MDSVRFKAGSYVLFRVVLGEHRFWRGGFDPLGFPRETRDFREARVFVSSAHAAKAASDAATHHSLILDFRPRRVGSPGYVEDTSTSAAEALEELFV